MLLIATSPHTFTKSSDVSSSKGGILELMVFINSRNARTFLIQVLWVWLKENLLKCQLIIYIDGCRKLGLYLLYKRRKMSDVLADAD